MYTEKRKKLKEEALKVHDEFLKEYELFHLKVKEMCDKKNVYTLEDIQSFKDLSLEELSDKYELLRDNYNRKFPECLGEIYTFIMRYHFIFMYYLSDIKYKRSLSDTEKVKFKSFEEFEKFAIDKLLFDQMIRDLNSLKIDKIDKIFEEIQNFEINKVFY